MPWGLSKGRRLSQLTYTHAVIIFATTVFIYASLVTVVVPSYISAPSKQGHDSSWEGWANIDTIFSFGDSYTDTGFQLNEQQPRPEDPLGNPTYDPDSPYLRWIQYLTMTYNDSKVETYNFAVSGATVDRDLIDRGSAFTTQVGETFLPNYSEQRNQFAGGEHERGSRRRKSRSSGNGSGPLATWEPQNTLFSIWFGINDNVSSNRSEVLFDQIFESYGRTLKQLHTAGAQNFLFLNVPPVHRGPQQSTSSSLAESITAWNARLANLTSNFGSTYPRTSVFLFDTYNLLNKILDEPEQFQQTRHLGNLTDQCDEYVQILSSQEMFEEECGLPINKYFWRDSLHVTFPVHDAVAARVAGMLRGE